MTERIQIDLRLVYEIDDPTVTEQEIRDAVEAAIPGLLRDDRENLRAWRIDPEVERGRKGA